MLELFERLHKKAGTKCERYLSGVDSPNQWKKDISGQKYYVIQGELFGGPYTMNIYLPDGCYRPKPKDLDDE